MNRQQIQEIILRVLAECGEQVTGRELPLDFPVEVSAKHVHLTKEAVGQLFGAGAKLTPKRPLSQPGQFLSEERVTLVTPKGRIENVAVLGPEREEVQTELSLTDCRALGIDAPICMSGDLAGAGDVYIIGPKGMIFAKESVIIAQAHIHITPPEAGQIGITDGQRVSVTIGGERKITLENVICRVSSQAALAMHIDFDEANACMLPKNATARMRVSGGVYTGETCADSLCKEQRKENGPGSGNAAVQTCRSGKYENTAAAAIGEADRKAPAASSVFEGKLITEAVARRLASEKQSTLTVAKGVILTPSAKDVLRQSGIEVLWQERRQAI